MIGIIELTTDQVVGMNRRVIANTHARDPNCQQQHRLVRPSDLASCLAGIFYQSVRGYEHLPLERMAGLLLYRLAERQAFEDGNKRTALVATIIFLSNHGLSLRLRGTEVEDLLWGFAKGANGEAPRFREEDAIQFIFDNVLPKSS